MSIKLSICMMVKNEENNLERCLNSLNQMLSSIDSELIIVDTGSTDRTVEIAKQYTDKVYFHQWNNNFSEMRNITINYAKGEWILIIDADEEIENSEEIIKFLRSKKSKNFNTIILTINNIVDFNNRYADTLLKSTRIFRRDPEFKYVGAVHNQPVFKKPIIEIKAVFNHYGYITTDKELMEKKFDRTCKLLLSELEKDPENIYNRSQLSVTYGMHGDITKGLEEIAKAYEVLKDKSLDKSIEYIYVYNRLATAYYTNDRFEETEQICKKALEIDKKSIDLHYFLAKSQYILKKYEESIDNYLTYFKLIDEYYNSVKLTDIIALVYTINRQPSAHYDLFNMYNSLNDIEKAIKHIEYVDDIRIIHASYNDIIKCYLKAKKYKELVNYAVKIKINQYDLLENSLICTIEDESKSFDINDRTNLYYELCVYNSNNYALLNSIRTDYFKEGKIDDEKVNTLIKNIDFNECFDYYGDIFYYLLAKKRAVEDLFINISDTNIGIFLNYIKEHHDDTYDVIKNYIDVDRADKQVKFFKTSKNITRVLLSIKTLPDEVYLNMFKLYVDYGVNYIKNIYSEKVIENELIYDVKNDEEIFFLYMYNAERLYKNNELEYIKCLRKALEKVPMMKRGIELLLEEIKQNQSNENSEMRRLKTQLKDNIKAFIESGNIEIAESLIKEYERIVSDDIEIVLFKSQIGVAKLKQGSGSEYKM